ncbi:hypothetical protein [Streptococcus suis]|uniref:hypothetical protein n=1 Tax=Streptococcus suis TaxID=1307 RepID=UPI002AB3A5A4|nr:hypothetical protein [Streptococcus suis]MDY7596214.1 hypothetical protein [Streptococcus suis]
MKIKHLLTFAITIACAFTLAACDEDAETTSAYEEKQSTLKLADKFSEYNEYILKNSYVWGGNIPADIDIELEILHD